MNLASSFLVAITVTLAACKPVGTTDAPSMKSEQMAVSAADPVAEFKKVVERFPKEGERRVDFVFRDIGFDVKKTDSLITPIIGIIGFDADYQGQYKTPALRYSLRLQWENDVWKLHSFTMDGGNRDADGGDLGKAMKVFLDLYR